MEQHDGESAAISRARDQGDARITDGRPVEGHHAGRPLLSCNEATPGCRATSLRVHGRAEKA